MTRLRKTFVATFLFFSGLPLRAAPQRPPNQIRVDSGALVRIWLGPTSRSVGRLLQPISPRAQSLSYCRYPGPRCAGSADSARVVTVAIPMITRLDVRHGSYGWLGGLIGAAFGVGLAGPWTACDTQGCQGNTGQRQAGFGILFGVVGYLIGDGSTHWVSAH